MNKIRIKWQRTAKQKEAWGYLFDTVTTLLFFGGGAGGAKTFLGCAWLIICALSFNKSRWFMARKELKSLKESTLETFFEICERWEIKAGIHYKYNQQDGYILFKNGSKIVLKQLKSAPSDPEFESVGSMEYTGGFIDESTQVAEKGVEAMSSRIRYKLDDFGHCQSCGLKGDVPKHLKAKQKPDGSRDPLVDVQCPSCGEKSFNSLVGKIFLTGNPSKNWTYREFYLKWKAIITGKGQALESHKKFIQALVTDNPFASKRYIESLRNLKNKAMRERLLKGNWEWDDDESKLMEYGNIVDIFSNSVEQDTSEKYISCDVARKGVDQTVVMLWYGFAVVKIIVLPKEEYHKTTQISSFLKTFAKREGVPRSNIVIDEGGVGGGVVDEMSETDGHNQVYGFIGSARPIDRNSENDFDDNKRQRLNYGNLRAQCFDALGDAVNSHEISVLTEDSEIKDLIIEELGQIKIKDIDSDGPIYIVEKKKIKEDLGRSPDFADCLSMRFVFTQGVNIDEDLIESLEFDV